MEMEGSRRVMGGRPPAPLRLKSEKRINNFLLQGVLVGYAIILPSILLNYITGGGTSQLETILNFVGGVLFVAVGSLGLSHEGYAIGFLNLGIGIIFLVEVVQVLQRSTLPQ